MRHETQTDRNRGISVVRFSGLVTPEDLQGFLSAYYQPRRGQTFDLRLVDFSRVTEFPFYSKDVQVIADCVRSNAEHACTGKVAMVASQDLIYGMLRVFKSMTQGFRYPLEVFRSVEEALLWLYSPVGPEPVLAPVPTFLA
jgi:hypothetical protein